MCYRTVKELMDAYRFTDRKAVVRRVEFIEAHPERYPPESVKRNDQGRLLIDVDAFDDCYTYKNCIEKGCAPAFKRGVIA